MQEIFSGLHQRAFRNKADNLCAGDADSAGGSRAGHLVKSYMQGCLGDVGDIHRNLSDSIFVDEPSDCLGAFQRSGLHDGLAVLVLERFAGHFTSLAHRTAFLAHVKSDGVCAAGRCGVQVEVDGDEEIAGADCGCAGAGCSLVKRAVAEVRPLAFVIHLFGKRLIFAGAAHRQVLAFGNEGSRFIAIGGDTQFVGHTLGQLAGEFGTFLQGDTADWDERAHIGCAHAGVSTVVIAHVDELGGAPYALECSLDHGLRLADESHDRTVGGLTRVDIKKFDVA